MKQAAEIISQLAEQYNSEEYFKTDPIIFPKHFYLKMQGKEGIFDLTKELEIKPISSNDNSTDTEYKYSIKDVEIAGVIAAHLAWGRRDMIVRDTKRAMEEMGWQPYRYVMEGCYRDENTSLHRTIKWSEFAAICGRLRNFYTIHESLEILSPDEIRVQVYGQKSNVKMANKKIHMFRRWMVRNDGIVDLGIWQNISPCELIIPLDVHVHRSALNLGITKRNSADFTTAQEITNFLKEVFPEDPCKGDFALFAYAASIPGDRV